MMQRSKGICLLLVWNTCFTLTCLIMLIQDKGKYFLQVLSFKFIKPFLSDEKKNLAFLGIITHNLSVLVLCPCFPLTLNLTPEERFSP